jgi:hypothetical protein
LELEERIDWSWRMDWIGFGGEDGLDLDLKAEEGLDLEERTDWMDLEERMDWIWKGGWIGLGREDGLDLEGRMDWI